MKFDTSADFLEWWISEPRLEGKAQIEFMHYYRSYFLLFNKYIKYWYSRQMLEVEENVKNNPKVKILDVGCGCGTESLWMSMLGAQVTGVDVSSEKIMVAKSRKRVLEPLLGRELELEFVNSGILSLPSIDLWDIIWMEQSFHHLEPREMVLDRLNEILKPGGILIFAESNAWNPIIQWTLFLARGFQTVVQHENVPWGNERILTPWKLSCDLKKRGLRIKSIKYFRVLPNRIYSNKFLFIEKMIPQFCIPLFTHYILIAEKI